MRKPEEHQVLLQEKFPILNNHKKKTPGRSNHKYSYRPCSKLQGLFHSNCLEVPTKIDCELKPNNSGFQVDRSPRMEFISGDKIDETIMGGSKQIR